MNQIDFNEIYHRYHKKLFQIGYAITKDSYLAEDIVHETFIKAMKKIEMVEDVNKIGSWLTVIATRTAIDVVRKERNRRWIPVEDEMLEYFGSEMMQNVEEEVEIALLFDTIKQGISHLTTEYQDVLLLKLVKGLKDQEIANHLSLKTCTVKTRIHRARQRLKHYVEKESA